MTPRLIPVLALFALAGCSKIHEQRSFTLEPGEVHDFTVSAPLSDQKIKVEVTSEQPLNVWVILEKDIPQGKTEFDPESLPSGVLAKEKATKQATLTATIPAKEKFRVYFDAAVKKTNVTVKIDSQ
jgi:inosine-uridine nucleoside N-ribohydrolase